MQRTALLAILAGLALATCPPPASAHGTYEAQELEVHVLNDEGSDAIEAYGGYDIQEAFIGSTYVPGHGPAVYVRLELYGTLSQSNGLMPWSVVVRYTLDGTAHEHTLSTTDGLALEHDFLGIEYEVEAAERTLHVQRAILSHGTPRPGQALSALTVESFWGDDLRDVAPGGIPAPLTQGLVEVPDPGAIDGGGRLVEDAVAPPVDAYFGAVSAKRTGSDVELTVGNGLRSGGQHVHLELPADATGWQLALGTEQAVLAANGTGLVSFTAQARDDARPVTLALTSDVGGRLELELRPDGSLHVRDAEVLGANAAIGAEESPGAGLLVALAALAAAAVVARRR